MTTPEEATIDAMQAQTELLDTIGKTFEAFVTFCKSNGQRVDLMSGAMQEMARATVVTSESVHDLKGFATTLAGEQSAIQESLQDMAANYGLLNSTIATVLSNQAAMMNRIDALAAAIKTKSLTDAQAAAESG